METTEVVVTRTIPASAEDIFDCWLDSSSPGGPWFGARKVILHPIVDGLFYHCFDHEGKAWNHYGRFLRIDRPLALEHTWVSEATQGLESIVTLTLEPEGEETRATIRHSGLPDDPMGLQHRDGWGWILDSLRDQLRDRATAG